MAHAHIYITFFTSENGSTRVVGECTSEYYEGTIQADSWKWDVDDNKKTGAEAGAEPSLLTFTKSLDASTTQLLQLMSGDDPYVFPSVRIDMYEDSLNHLNTQDSTFGMSLTLAQAQITEYSVSARNEDGLVQYEETWTLDYRVVTLEYWPDYAVPSESDDSGQSSSRPAPATVTILVRPVDAPDNKPGQKKEKEEDKNKGKSGSGGRNLPAGEGWKDTKLDWTDKTHELDSEGLARRRSGGCH